MKFRVWHGLLLATFVSIPAFSQDSDFDRFFSDSDQEFRNAGSMEEEMRREMGAFYSEAAQELQAFRDERDRDFAEFLKEKWQAFEEFDGLVNDPEPKPKVIPKAEGKGADDKVKPLGKPVAPPPVPQPPVVVIPPVPQPAPPTVVPATPRPQPAPEPQPQTPVVKTPPAPQPEPTPPPVKLQPEPAPVPPVVVTPPQPEPAPPVVTPPTVTVSYLGHDLPVVCDPALVVRSAGSLNNRTISAYWEEMSRQDFEPLLASLQAHRNALHLNDWAYYQFVQAVGETLHGPGNDANLFSWFALAKSGYRIRIGYSGDRLFLLAPAGSKVFQTPYYTLDGTRFYNISYFRDPFKPGRIYTYNKDYPRAEQSLQLDLPQSPLVGQGRVLRQLSFRYQGKDYAIPVAYNRHALKFYETYPQTDWAIYFAASPAIEAEQSLIENLGKLVAGKSETEAVNMLLRFAQTAFEYQTDDEQFGREKYMFAEETVAFPYSDCEDRSILFSYLVRKIVGLDVVGLHFPGHIATAVAFSEYVKGDAIKAGGKRYVVCDPTYINADIGMMMPQFKQTNPEVIRFNLF